MDKRLYTLVFVASAILLITMGVRQTSGLFLVPITQSTGVSVVAMSFALAVGQLLWGAAQPVFGAIADKYGAARVVVAGAIMLALGNVPSIDATGLVALESALRRLKASHKHVVLSGPLPQPRQVFERADLPRHYDNVRFAPDLQSGIALAAQIAEELDRLEPPAKSLRQGLSPTRSG